MRNGKMKYSGKWIYGLAVLAFLLLAAGPVAAGPLKVFVSIAPQKYFVERIGGNLVSVSVLVPPSADAHTYEPKPRQMKKLVKCAVYFAIGVDFERAWLPKIAPANPQMLIVHTEEGIPKIPMEDHSHGYENKGQGGPTGALDPHIWLSPRLVKVQAGHILRSLVELDSKNQAFYKSRYDAFLGEINSLDTELKSLLAAAKGRRFMVFHPSWGYFARDYGLEQVPIEIAGKDPKPADLVSLIRRARELGIKAVFVQPQFSAKSAAMVAREIAGQVFYVNPLAENWPENLREVGRQLAKSAR